MTSESVWLEDAFRSAARFHTEVQLVDEGGSPRHSCFLDPAIASKGRPFPTAFPTTPSRKLKNLFQPSPEARMHSSA